MTIVQESIRKRENKDRVKKVSMISNERNRYTYLSRITWILGIYKMQRGEKIDIHGCIHSMAQVIHVFLAKILQQIPFKWF